MNKPDLILGVGKEVRDNEARQRPRFAADLLGNAETQVERILLPSGEFIRPLEVFEVALVPARMGQTGRSTNPRHATLSDLTLHGSDYRILAKWGLPTIFYGLPLIL